MTVTSHRTDLRDHPANRLPLRPPGAAAALALVLAATLGGGSRALAQSEPDPPDCEAATAEGEPLSLFLDAPAPGTVTSSYEPECPASVEVRGVAVVGPRLFDFYLALDSSGSAANCTGVDIDGDGIVGVPSPFPGPSCTDPGDSILAAEVKAYRDLVEELSPERSRVAIIQFSSPEGTFGTGERQRIVQPLTSDFSLVMAALDEVLAAGPAGATDYGGGIELMRDALRDDGEPATRRQLGYFQSDGVPTFPEPPFTAEDPGDSEAALDAADRAAGDGLEINTFGVGFTPSTTRDPVVPRRCLDPSGPGEVSTLECIALRTGGEFRVADDPADIVELIRETLPAGIASVTVFNDTLGVSVEADRTADGGWSADVPTLPNETNVLRAVAVADDGTTCEVTTSITPLCFAAACDPRTQGYWHRQCLGLGDIEPGRERGRSERRGRTRRGGEERRPRPHPDWDSDLLRGLLTSLVDPVIAGLGSPADPDTCAGLDAEPPSDPCQRAIKQYAALRLNMAGGRLAPDCEVDLSELGPGLPTTAGEAADLVDQLIRDGLAGDPAACKRAAAIADLINTGEAL